VVSVPAKRVAERAQRKAKLGLDLPRRLPPTCLPRRVPTPTPTRTLGSVSSSGCTPRTPTAAATTLLAATRLPTPADAAEAPNTNMRALRKGASVSSRRRVAWE